MLYLEDLCELCRACGTASSEMNKEAHDDWVSTLKFCYNCIVLLISCFSLDPVYCMQPVVSLALCGKATIGAGLPLSCMHSLK